MQISADQFAAALDRLSALGRRPGKKQMDFIRAHYEAPDRTATATALAESAAYSSYSAVNLQYGLLARALAEETGATVEDGRPWVSLIVEFERPKVKGGHWRLKMGDEFARGLEKAGWV
ncbi:MAG TPA: hypothetical protein VKX45_24685 [Bryobacteraceae bacterium]|nr:hypothetical protein [Bryobacteraceae bacterium]